VTPPAPLRVGVVGAGPWARQVHIPLFAAGPDTELTAIWARRPEAAGELTAAWPGVRVCQRFEELVDAVEAVAFAVPPDVQARLAPAAAAAGRAVLLEKPLALDLAGAERLAEAVAVAGVGSLVVLTWRYAPAVRQFLERAGALAAVGGRGWFLSGALLGGWYSTPWRLEHGALLDIGPHVLDLLDAALGPVVDVRANGRSTSWVGLLLRHESGAVSEASLSGSIWPEARRAGVEVFGATAAAEVDTGQVGRSGLDTLRAEFVAVARAGAAHPQAVLLGADRGLYLQRWLDTARRQLEGGPAVR